MFDPTSTEPSRISRSAIESFLRCPRCFYINRRLGIYPPDGPPFVLNIRIDQLMKKDSDRFRESQTPIPRAQRFGINATPFQHPKIKKWFDTRHGLQYLHLKTNLIIFSAPDDIWLVDNENLSIVDTKATHSNKPINESYFWSENKRQVEICSWLLEQQDVGYPVSKTGYFIRLNTNKEQTTIEGNYLEFNQEIIPYTGNYDWIEPTIFNVRACLMRKTVPDPSGSCRACEFRAKISEIEK